MAKRAPKSSLLADIKPPGRSYVLLVDEILQSLPAAERTELEQALCGPAAYGAASIAQVLTARGHRCSTSAVYKWRRQNGVSS